MRSLRVSSSFDVAVVIGRFQPYHLGHAKLVRHALSIADSVVIVLGSDQKARDPYNPFTSSERIDMISGSLSEDERRRTAFCPVRDMLYSDHRWFAATVNAVNGATEELRERGLKLPRQPRIALVGNQKDLQTKAYLEMFCGTFTLVGLDCWRSGQVPGREGTLSVLSATQIRAALFEERFQAADRLVPSSVAAGLRQWREGLPDVWTGLVAEHHFYEGYKRAHQRREVVVTNPTTGESEAIVMNPYGVTFQTVDAVVAQNGHVLLVKRRHSPGKGLWALPGGFLKPDESRLDGVLRELREETRIKLPEKVLRGSLRESKGFDHPRRSLRGRTITEAFFFRLDDANDLPGVRGGDDAERARWIPFADLMRMESQLFEDHFHIVEYFLARF